MNGSSFKSSQLFTSESMISARFRFLKFLVCASAIFKIRKTKQKKKKKNVAPTTTKNAMKSSRQVSVNNDYGACAGIGKGSLADKKISFKNTCWLMCFAQQNQNKHL